MNSETSDLFIYCLIHWILIYISKIAKSISNVCSKSIFLNFSTLKKNVRRLTENKTRLSELWRKEGLFSTNRSLAIRIVSDFISFFNRLIQDLEQKINELKNIPKGFFASKSDKQKALDLKMEIKDLRQTGRGKISSAKETITEYLVSLDFPETSSLRKKCEGIQVGSESELPSPARELKSIEDELKICLSPFIEERKSISAESVRLFEILQAVEREISGSISEYCELLGRIPLDISFERQTLDNEERSELINMRRRTKN